MKRRGRSGGEGRAKGSSKWNSCCQEIVNIKKRVRGVKRKKITRLMRTKTTMLRKKYPI
jgi:hypothetical protein